MRKDFRQQRENGLLNKLRKELHQRDQNAERTRNRPRLHDHPLPAVEKRSNTSYPKLLKLERNFVHHYCTHYDQIRAAREAGYPAGRSHVYAKKLLDRPDIRGAIAEVEYSRMKRLRVEGDYLLNRILQIALADPNEVVQIRIPPCRYCYGANHQYQRTYAEMERDLEVYNRGYIKLPDKTIRRLRKGDPPFDEQGGIGYDTDLSPNPECPECHGRGEASRPILHFKDSRYLSPEGRAIYAGGERTQFGVKVALRNQDAAWSFLSRFAERWMEQHRRPQLRFHPEEMSTEELEKVIADAEEMGFGLIEDHTNDDDEGDE